MGSSQDDWQQMSKQKVKQEKVTPMEGLRDNLSGDFYDHVRKSIDEFLKLRPVGLTTALGVLEVIKHDMLDEA